MELFAKLGIDWRLLVFQIVNFSIVLIVLWRFLYRPLIAFLEKRKERIEEGLVFAREMERKLAAADEESAHRLTRAKSEAQSIMERATKNADKIKTELTAKADSEARRIVERAACDMAAEKEKILADIKKEAAALVVAATRQVLSGEIDEKRAKHIVDNLT
ncbi:MAG: F0F1 ATP synthase subunit B [Candidatus Niyogibacteria bacterium]|nr:F0F1 ATP synthase subunit B [Candidatus Niyogibacteria bacterium]